jgi:hypothetical protein
MIDQLRRKLDQADTWPKYRQELKEFRELYGPTFKLMPVVARQKLRLTSPGQTTFANLTRREDTAPDWTHVSLFIKVCVRHAQDEQEGMEDLGAHLAEIVGLWREAFIRLGGKLPESPPAKAATLTAPAGRLTSSSAEAPVIALSGTPEHRSPRWRAARDRVRRWPKKLTIPVGLLVAASLIWGSYALATADWDKDRTVEAAGSSPSSASSADTAQSSLPTAGSASARPTGSASTAGAVPGGAASGTGDDAGGGGVGAGGAGIASGGTGSDSASGGVSSSGSSSSSSTSGGATASGGASGTGTTGSAGGGTATETQPYINSVIAWSNDGNGNPDPKDPGAIVKVYDTYKQGAGTSVHQYYRTDPIRVKCQVTGGRRIDLGEYYSGPTPHRDGIWYLMDTGEWVPAVFVNTGRSSLPACSAADAGTAS